MIGLWGWVFLGVMAALLTYMGWLMCTPICIDPERFSLRCKLGLHPAKFGSYESKTHMGMGVFGGPTFSCRWTCRRCGGRCSQ